MNRAINEGFSGGEKKRNEILQMLLLEPRSRSSTRPTRASTSTRCASWRRRQPAARPERSMLVITHYQRLLDYIVPDYVHVLSEADASSTRAARSWRSSSREGLRLAREGASGSGDRRMSELDAARERWLSQAQPGFAAARPTGARLAAALRSEALGTSRSSGLPGRRLEEWRYTNVAPIARGLFEPAAPRSRRARPGRDRGASPFRSSPAASSSS